MWLDTHSTARLVEKEEQAEGKVRGIRICSDPWGVTSHLYREVVVRQKAGTFRVEKLVEGWDECCRHTRDYGTFLNKGSEHSHLGPVTAGAGGSTRKRQNHGEDPTTIEPGEWAGTPDQARCSTDGVVHHMLPINNA